MTENKVAEEFNQLCSSKNVIDGNLWETRPDVACLLKYPEDGYKYKQFSHKKLIFVCPYCHRERQYIVSNISRRGFSCKFCSDGISYPNKFIINMLFQMNIDVTPEYSPKWIYPKRYDVYFIYRGNEYIIEMDGAMGHGVENYKYNPDVNKSIENDNFKSMMAKEHGIDVIRVDCKYGSNDRKSYIINSIIHSDLNNIFDLSIVDFDECDKNAQNSLFVAVCKLWNNGMKNHYDIARELHISTVTVTTYLKKSEKYNITDYCHKEYSVKNGAIARKRAGEWRKIMVMCIETHEIFRSIKDATNKYSSGIYAVVNTEKAAGRLSDGTLLHWVTISKEDVDNLINSGMAFYA